MMKIKAIKEEILEILRNWDDNTDGFQQMRALLDWINEHPPKDGA